MIWNGQAVYTTIEYGQIARYIWVRISILITMSVCYSEFSVSLVMVLAFKKGHNANLIKEKKYFNTKLAKVSIKNAHCSRLHKSRFKVCKVLGE